MPMSEKWRAYHAAYAERRHAEYWAAHDSTPLCGCGCGEHVNLNADGKPYKYAGVNHHSRVTSSAAMKKGWKTRRFRSGAVSMEDFRYATHVIKYHNAWTWTDMAAAFDIPDNRLRSMLHDKRLKSIGSRIVVGYFENLTGKSVPETMDPCQWVFRELGLKWEPSLKPTPQW